MASTYCLRFVSIVVICLAGLSVGCDQQIEQGQFVFPFNSVVLNSPTVTIDIYSIKGAKPPEEAWSRAMERFGSYLSGELVVNVRQARIETKEDGSESYILDDQNRRGDHFTVAVFPKSNAIRRGRYMKYNNGWQMIQYFKGSIEKYDWLFSRESLWEIVLLHEFGHGIGVPADVSHADKTGHCTNHCVMYPRPDLRSAWGFLRHGLNLDFCDDCKAEIAAAKITTE